MRLRVADAVSVLDAIGVQRAHFVGTSYGGRLCFGIGQHASDRVLSLVIGGQQPYPMDPDTALGRLITESLAASQATGTMEPFVDALEKWARVPLPEDKRALWLENDPAAIEAASAEMLAEGDVAVDLRSWEFRCLLFVGAADVDFFEGAQRAVREIPNAEFVSLTGRDHIGAHLDQDPVLTAVFRTLGADAQGDVDV
jgi:pimeloyl-ACP methyl ester carboxylesterase